MEREPKISQEIPKETLGWLRSGEIVVNRPQSHIDKNAPGMDWLEDALALINTDGREFITEEVTFSEIIGVSNCVETSDGSEIVYAKRHGRRGYSRFTKNQSPLPTNKFTVVLKKGDHSNDGQEYILITAFLGPLAAPEPWDKNADENSIEFWQSHALVWDESKIIPGTEISEPEYKRMIT